MFEEMDTLKMFFEEPTREFNVREVARIIDVSPSTASKELKSLARRGLLRERKERMLTLYAADLESDFYRDFKTFYNIRKIKESGLLEALNRFYLKPSIVLFGSAASGMDTETSDIDLLVVSERTEEFGNLRKFEKKMKRTVQIFPVKEIKGLRNEHLINNVLNGITIQGKIKWI